MRAVSVRSIVTAGLARVRAFRDRFRVWEVRYRWWTWKARVLETVRSWARAAAWTGLVVVIPPLGVFILMAETGLWVYPGVPRRLYGLAEYGLAQAWFCGRGRFYRLACLAYRRGMFDYQAFVEKAGDRAPRDEFHKAVWHLLALTTLGLAVDLAEAGALWFGLREGLRWLRRQDEAARRRRLLRETLTAPLAELERPDPARAKVLRAWLLEARVGVPPYWWSHAAALVLAVLLRHRGLPASTERGKFHDADRGAF